jgi:ribosomal protein S18 acetylase RimI-like enzyme
VSSYRFCRSDDVPLLVEAYKRCYRVHFPELPELTVDGFKRWIRRLDVWTSSCMVAASGSEPIGVLVAGKRPDANLVFRVGVAPGHQRHGHASHLMSSLAQKLAILGPRRMVAELPEESGAARRFVERCGYEVEDRFTDFEHPGGAARPRGIELAFPVTVDELQAGDALASGAGRSWLRSVEALVRGADELRGLALASDVRIEAFVLYREPERGPIEVLGLSCVDEGKRDRWLRTLLVGLCAAPRAVRLVRLDDGDPPGDLIESWGFRPAGRTLSYVTEAGAA